MLCRCLLPLLLLLVLLRGRAGAYFSEERSVSESGPRAPTVLVALLARNAARSLPYALGCLERLDYPKDRMALWVATDHNIDNTTAVLMEWLMGVQKMYHYVEWRPLAEPLSYLDEVGPKHWSASRYEYVMKLRQGALNTARERWADYIFFVDVDNFLLNEKTLSFLVAQNRTIVAPMLDSRTAYSNYWSAMTEQGYYKRAPEYLPVRERERLGCFRVPMVHSTFLIDLRREASRLISFYPPPPNYAWPFDDIIVFAASCKHFGVPMYICNQHRFGHLVVPGKAEITLQDDVDMFIHTHLEIMVEEPPMKPSQYIHMPERELDKMGFDEVYMINLKRRPERRLRMLRSLEEQQIQCKVVDAVDGKALNKSQIRALGVDMLPGYHDPYSGRVLTKGEIGCFLSHYGIWQEVVDRGLPSSLVLEDDVRFEPFFRHRLERLIADVKSLNFNWDLIYIGRKKMQIDTPERSVKGIRNLVWADYSYWTLAYAVSLQGARKLLAGEPLGRMLPVDEYLPVMFNKHPIEQYLEYFEPRDLRAFSAEPLLVYPTQYTGEANYVSDTETSTIWDDRDGTAAPDTNWGPSPKMEGPGASGGAEHSSDGGGGNGGNKGEADEAGGTKGWEASVAAGVGAVGGGWPERGAGVVKGGGAFAKELVDTQAARKSLGGATDIADATARDEL
ncbi:procollagen galactosyltransferase 1-like [Lampetra planeri]